MLVAICHPDIPSRLPQGGSCLLGHNLILPFCSERTSGYYWSFTEKMRGGSWRCVSLGVGWGWGAGCYARSPLRDGFSHPRAPRSRLLTRRASSEDEGSPWQDEA